MPVEGRFVQVANGVMVPIKGVGQALVVMHGVNGHAKAVKLPRALHVPDFSTNLLSVDALWELNGVRTRFEDQNELIFPDGESVRLKIKMAQLEKQLAKKDTGALASIGQQQSAQLKAAVKIQCCVRCFVCRSKFRASMHSIITVQAFSRGVLDAKQYVADRSRVIQVSSSITSFKDRMLAAQT